MDNSVGIWYTRQGWSPSLMNQNLVPSPSLEFLTLEGIHDGLDPQGPMSRDLI